MTTTRQAAATHEAARLMLGGREGRKGSDDENTPST